jgi:cation diffusion facilitator CzcD-associated flavoprotein CzcO
MNQRCIVETVPERVCVVGAGPAGLAMARALKIAGIDFDLFEKHSAIGGIWDQTNAGSPVYDSAHFISSKAAPNSTFRGHPFPVETPAYPSHRQVRDYLENFVTEESLGSHLRLNTPVAEATKLDKGWRVKAGSEIHYYSAIVCASGTLWTPKQPGVSGAESFTVRACW